MPKKINTMLESTRRLERMGYDVCSVERRVNRVVTFDCFGFADLIAMHPEHGTILVQTTSASNMAARLKKVKAEPRHRTWLLAGRGWHRIEVHGWRKDKTGKWVCRTVEVGL